MSVTAKGSDYGAASVWHLTMLCPRCAGNLALENQGQALTRECASIVRCETCHAPQTLLVRLLEVGYEPGLENEGRLGVAVCGTDSGYHRHRSLGEATCVRCRNAHAQAEHDRRGNK